MATLELSFNNPLGSAEQAKSKLQYLLPSLVEQYRGEFANLHERWIGLTNVFGVEVRGNRIYGVLLLDNTRLSVTAEVPLVVTLASKKLRSILEQKIQELLVP